MPRVSSGYGCAGSSRSHPARCAVIHVPRFSPWTASSPAPLRRGGCRRLSRGRGRAGRGAASGTSRSGRSGLLLLLLGLHQGGGRVLPAFSEVAQWVAVGLGVRGGRCVGGCRGEQRDHHGLGPRGAETYLAPFRRTSSQQVAHVAEIDAPHARPGGGLVRADRADVPRRRRGCRHAPCSGLLRPEPGRPRHRGRRGAPQSEEWRLVTQGIKASGFDGPSLTSRSAPTRPAPTAALSGSAKSSAPRCGRRTSDEFIAAAHVGGSSL